MDDMEDDDRYHPKPHHHTSSNRRTIHLRHPQFSRPPPPPNPYNPEDDDDDDEENYQNDVVPQQRHYHHNPNSNPIRSSENGFEWHPKKRKLKNILPDSSNNYEFLPRVKPPGRVGSEEWTEHAVFVLLEVWGDRFLQLGRKSLRSEDWGDVAAKVSEGCKFERNDKECRAMLDNLKRKYKKEKARMEETGVLSKWGYYKKMEMLMGLNGRQECGLACGVDNGEYVFMNTRVYLEKSNGYDEMRDSPGESESEEEEEEEREENGGFGFGVGVGPRGGGGSSSFRVLAESIQKFGEIYENVESSKRQQMMELEKMRREFNKEMEMQKKQILERAQAEIAKIQEAADDDDDDDDEEEEDDAEEEDEEEEEGVSAEDISE